VRPTSALATYRRRLPEIYWEVGRALSQVGGSLLDRGAIEDAAPLLRDGLRILEADPRSWGTSMLNAALARVARLDQSAERFPQESRARTR
jgi:hypothetical protein